MIDLMNLSEPTYIYGAGKFARICSKFFDMNGVAFQGFIVSDGEQISDNKLNEKQVMHLQDLKNIRNASIIVSVSEQYWKEIDIEINGHIIRNNCLYKVRYLTDSEITEMRRLTEPVIPEDFFKKATPLGELMGYDRGSSIGRYYIKKYLDEMISEPESYKGNIYEVGESRYSQMFFPNANHFVLDYSKGDDLTKLDTLPEGTMDYFICTQVFNFIYDIKSAIYGGYHVLKEGGTLIATVAGNISQVSRSDMKNYGDFWRFTYLSIERLFGEVFGSENISVKTFGNAMSTTAYIQGMCYEDISHPELLDINDPEYALVIGVTARKK